MRTLEYATLALAFAASCAPRSWKEKDADPSLVRVDTEHLNIRHDTVGEGRWLATASFVLVDARNPLQVDLMITLAGELLDGDGHVVGSLQRESLRVDAKATRTFALVERDKRKVSEAVSARIRATSAFVLTHPSPVRIEKGRVHRDGDRVVVQAIVRNAAARNVRVVVHGGFYDAAGVPTRRPFEILSLDGKTTHPAQFVGPSGSVRGYIFVGQMVY